MENVYYKFLNLIIINNFLKNQKPKDSIINDHKIKVIAEKV